MQFIRKIAVRPYVLKYLAHDYDIDPFVINKTNKYGLFLWHCLSKPRLKAIRPESKEKLKAIAGFRELMPFELKDYSDQEILDGLAISTVYNHIAALRLVNAGLAEIMLEEFKKLKLEKKDPIDVSIYSAKLPVMISENYYYKNGGYIAPGRELDFNKMVMYDFHEEFYKYVRNRIGRKGSINQAILNFRDQFDISEDELSFKTIQRAFQRHHEAVNRSLSA